MLSCCAAQGQDIIRLYTEDMSGPCIERRRAVAGEIMALIHGGYTAQLCRLVRQQLIDDDAVKAESGQRRNARSPEIMQAPGNRRHELASHCGHGVGPRLCDRGIEVPLALREA